MCRDVGVQCADGVARLGWDCATDLRCCCRVVADGRRAVKNAFRQSMAWLHTYAGLLVGWVLYFMFLTGTLGYFDTEIDRWMRPQRPLATAPVSFADSVDVARRRLGQVADGADQWFINPAVGRDNPDLRIFYRPPPDADGKRGASTNELLDTATGEPLSYRETGGGQVLYQMHYELYYMPAALAYWIAGVCAMFMLVALITGIVVHRKIFKDLFTFRPGKQQRSWLDAHNVLGVAALPFHLMITYSGLVFFVVTYMPFIIDASYGSGEKNRQVYFDELTARQGDAGRAGVAAPLASLDPMIAEAARRWGTADLRSVDIRYPGDANARVSIGRTTATPLRSTERLVFDGTSGALIEVQGSVTSTPRAVRDVLLGLHEGLFAGAWLRWLYFFSGLLGTAMIGTGLVLWTVKRRTQQVKQEISSTSLVLVERLNAGTLIGLPIGIAAYFWANRLIPAVLEGRAQWEVHSMFITWALMLVHAHCRPRARVWPEQLWVAAAAFLLLPVINACTTQRHLGMTLMHGDWVLAGFDLTLFAVGVAFALTAIRLRSRAVGTVRRKVTMRASAVETG
jgi:uncharacterized iron-regulated membrane protein